MCLVVFSCLSCTALALLTSQGSERHYKPGEVRKAREGKEGDNTLEVVTLVSLPDLFVHYLYTLFLFSSIKLVHWLTRRSHEAVVATNFPIQHLGLLQEETNLAKWSSVTCPSLVCFRVGCFHSGEHSKHTRSSAQRIVSCSSKTISEMISSRSSNKVAVHLPPFATGGERSRMPRRVQLITGIR